VQLVSESTAISSAAAASPKTRNFLVSSVGAVAKQLLNSVHTGQVLVVFERSFYVETSSGIFCVGLPEIGRGPLNALLATQSKGLPFEVMSGEQVRILKHRISFSGNHLLDATKAYIYHHATQASAPNSQLLENNRNALKDLNGMPVDGFYWLLDCPTVCRKKESSLQRALRESTATSLARLNQWLRSGFIGSDKNENITEALGLVGAGPGLTPAGDDLLAGVMIALVRLQRADLSRRIWQAVVPSLPSLTNTISAAHMEQAAVGLCSEFLNDLIDSIFRAEKLEVATLGNTLNRMGCTSGWDTLAGAVLVIDAWLHSIKYNK